MDVAALAHFLEVLKEGEAVLEEFFLDDFGLDKTLLLDSLHFDRL